MRTGQSGVGVGPLRVDFHPSGVMSDPNPAESSENSTVDPVEGVQGEAGGHGDPLKSIPKIVRFESLARCGDEIWIENEGQIYRLRKTRQGKLILTK